MVIDTSVLIAGISGFRRPFVPGRNSSADLLHNWAEKSHFVWLISEEILDEYKDVMRHLGVRPQVAGTVINLVRERAEEVEIRTLRKLSPDPADDAFCICAEEGRANFIVTLNSKDFPQERLTAKVLSPNQFA